MSTVEVVVCDVCHEVGKPTRRYEVTGDGMTAAVDLCEEDGAMLAEFLATHGRRRPGRRPAAATSPLVAKKATSKRAAGRPRATTPRMTIEEIEAQKKGK